VLNPPTKLNGTSSLTGPTDKPEVFYEGAEYCPNCAAERWSMIVALSRFGTFQNLSQEHSSSTDVDPNTATFSFYHSSYISQYIDFVPLERQSYSGVSLETPTADEQQIINTYNPGEAFPFIDVANTYLFLGASYDPAVLRDLDWQSIADLQGSSTSSTEVKWQMIYYRKISCKRRNKTTHDAYSFLVANGRYLSDLPAEFSR
jgi:hypothetical protein